MSNKEASVKPGNPKIKINIADLIRRLDIYQKNAER